VNFQIYVFAGKLKARALINILSVLNIPLLANSHIFEISEEVHP
jgi:hypothetical protein